MTDNHDEEADGLAWLEPAIERESAALAALGFDVADAHSLYGEADGSIGVQWIVVKTVHPDRAQPATTAPAPAGQGAGVEKGEAA